MNKNGLYQKYHVQKLSNPEKVIDSLVLEFDDPLSRIALRKYAGVVRQEGMVEFARDIIRKCNAYEIKAPEGKSEFDCRHWQN